MVQGRYLVSSALSVLLLSTANPAFAQAAQESADDSVGSRFGDIVVTAQRREERLQDVPVAVSAFQTETLARAGITKGEELARITPSLQVGRFVGSPTATSFGIRGQRTNDIRINADSAVVVYVSEIPQHLPFGIGQTGFLDLQSVQVLRGPQGTLFGRNSTGGAVLLTPNTPTDEFEGSFKVRTGNYKKIEGQGVINLPLGEGVGLRLAGIAGHRDGYIRNLSGHGALNSENYYGGRGSFQVELGDFTSTFYGDYLSFHGSGNASKLGPINPAGLGLLVPGSSLEIMQNYQAQADRYFWSTFTTRPLRSNTRVWGVSNTSTYQMSDSFSLKNIVGYRDVRNSQGSEANGTPITLITSQITGGGWQFTEELQGQFDSGPIHLIGGVFYFREAGGDQGSTESLRGLILPIGPGGAMVPLGAKALYNNRIKNNALSGYLEGTFDITDSLHLTLGGRYTRDRRYRSGNNFSFRDPAFYPAPFAGTSCRFVVGGVPLPDDECFYEGKATFKKFTHNITVRYEVTPDHQTYASWRTGYRSGGFTLEATNPATNVAYGPETVDNYEVGYKGRFDLGADAGLRINLAAYLSKYDDIQKNQSTRDPVTNALITRTVNAAKATIKGIEAEASLFFGDNVTIDAAYAFNKAKYDDWLALDGQGNPVDLSGTPWGYLPKHKASVSARYAIPTGEDSHLAFQPTVSWQSSMQIEEVPGPGTRQRGYALVNGRVEYTQGDVTLALWGNNIFNKKYYVAGQNIYSALGYTGLYVGEPRTYGAELSVKF